MCTHPTGVYTLAAESNLAAAPSHGMGLRQAIAWSELGKETKLFEGQNSFDIIE